MADEVVSASGLAESLMSEELARRWRHVKAVAAAAESLRVAAGVDADVLVAAAWLHDIGYASAVSRTGFHPVDGARYLKSVGMTDRVCALVANHSGARHEAALRGFSGFCDEFPDEQSFVRDGLWYSDMTTGPSGDRVSFPERLAEIESRYGRSHVVPRGITTAAPEIRAAIGRVEREMLQFCAPGVNEAPPAHQHDNR